jgi:hypothetical protein
VTIAIPEQQIEVLAETDVLVCGGGCAGVAAAVAAARHGARVALLERWPSIGGMATNALVNGWHRSDREKVVINGLVEESVQRLDAEGLGWVVRMDDYPRSHETHWFEPEGMRIVWQRLLDEAKVRTYCNLTAAQPIVEGGRIRGVLADTKRGRRAFLGRIVVDATGDGDIAAQAGVPFDFGRAEDGLVQGMTLIFVLAGLDREALRAAGDDAAVRVWERMRELRDAGAFPPFNEANTLHYMRNMPAGCWRFWNLLPVAGNPLDEAELTRLTALSRERLVAYIKHWRNNLPGYANATIDQTGFGLGIRESRRVRGLKTLTADMVVGAVKQPDAIGHGVWMVDIHDPKGTGHTTYSDRGASNMLRAGTSYHIPLGMCLNNRIPNLAVVGRCASSTHEAHSSVRVQTHGMVMGQGVGVAAAQALASGRDMAQIEITTLQRTLRQDGVYLEDVPGTARCAV